MKRNARKKLKTELEESERLILGWQKFPCAACFGRGTKDRRAAPKNYPQRPPARCKACRGLGWRWESPEQRRSRERYEASKRVGRFDGTRFFT